MEKFNPFNPEYKKVAELPQEEQKNFKDVEGGFVKNTVIDKKSSEVQGLEIKKRAVDRFTRSKKYVPEYQQLSQPPKELYEKFSQELEFNDHQSKKIKEWALNLIKSWHDKIKPDLVFVTDTSGVPYGYVLKETWRSAYPEESMPMFYKINPKAPVIKNGNLQELAQTDFVDLRKIKDNSRIVVFDEGQAPYEGFDSIYQLSSEGQRLNKDGSPQLDEQDSFEPHTWKSRYKAAIAIHKLLKKNNFASSIWVSSQAAQDFDERNQGIDYIRSRYINITTKKYRSSGSYENNEVDKYYREGQIDEDIIGIPVKNPNDRFLALEFIKKLKQFGREAGEQLRKELEEQK